MLPRWTPLTAIAATMLVSSTVSAQHTFWIDSSCTNQAGWQDHFDGARSMAAEAAKRLGSKTDTDFANVFNHIFHTDKNKDSAGLKKARDMMNEIGNEWKETTKREDADARFYCDNDDRWKQMKDEKDPTKPRMVGGTEMWIDEDNWVFSKGPKCKEVGKDGKTAKGMTYTLDSKLPANNKNTVEKRASITICDQTFKRSTNPKTQKERVNHIKDLATAKDLSKINSVSGLSGFPAMTILHEWTHAFPYKTADEKSPNSYGWANIMKMSKDESFNNADSYAYLGIWAALASRGERINYSLQRPYKDPNSEGGKKAEEAMQAGKLKLYKAITKRWLGALIGNHFTA